MTQFVELGGTGVGGRSYAIAVEKNQSITVRSTDERSGEQTFRTFAIGDIAEYDSYNLSYTGKITGITEKTVTIQPQYKDRAKRLKALTFCWRNYDFDLEETARRNFETSMHI